MGHNKRISTRCKFKLFLLSLLGIIVLIYLLHITQQSFSSPIQHQTHLQILHHTEPTLNCAQFNDIKDMHTIADIVNSSLVDIMQYLSKRHCPELLHDPSSYIEHHTFPNLNHQQQQQNQRAKLDIAHVLNMYKADIHDYSYLHFAAPVTFVSMLKAKQYGMKHGISVGLYSVNFREDNSVVPVFINKLPNLPRSLQDSVYAQNLSNPQRVPFLSDIIDTLLANVDCEYVVYTNADIGVQPHFYYEVMKLLQRYPVGMSITRRSIEYESRKTGELLTFLDMPEIYEQGLAGKVHGGHDCFVFRSDKWNEIDMRNVFLGYPPIGKTFAVQLEAYGKEVGILRDRHLTFHIGFTRKMTKFLNSHGWRKKNQSVKYDVNYEQHAALNRAFCETILQRKNLKLK